MTVVRIPGLLPRSPNGSHGHWSARYRRTKSEREAVARALLRARRPALPVVVTLTRCSPWVLDDDNVVAAYKAVRDAVAAWLGVDDRDPRVTWRVEQRRCKRAEAGTEIALGRRAA